MSRISLGITLSIVAIALAVAGMVSFFMPVSGVWAVTDRASMVLHFFDGRARVFWITSQRERINVMDRSDRGPNLWVHQTSRRSGFHEAVLPRWPNDTCSASESERGMPSPPLAVSGARGP